MQNLSNNLKLRCPGTSLPFNNNKGKQEWRANDKRGKVTTETSTSVKNS